MVQNSTTSRIYDLSSNFNEHDALPFVTKSALIKLADLEKFILDIKKDQADSVRIYFIRFPIDKTPTSEFSWKDGRIPEGCNWHESGLGLTQASIIMVPTQNFKMDEEFIFSADDLEVDGHITYLMPGIQDLGTGLNPPSPKIII